MCNNPVSIYRFRLCLCLLFMAALFSFQPDAKAQGRPKVVQLSGLVVSGDSLYGLPGASVYVRKAGRGTVTNEYGYFSLPVLAGDSVTMSMVGYRKHHLYIPKNYNSDSYSVIIEMKEDTTVLPVISVYPWPTEKMFREAFLSLKLPTKDKSNAEKNLDEQLMARIFAKSDYSTMPNQLYLQQQNVRQIEMRNQVVANPLLNPFAWAQFIEAIKRGDLKKRKGVDFE